MKFTLSWLKDHLDTSASLTEITNAMTMAGLEVEEVSDPAEAFAAFSVARIVSAAPHPNADKLQVCQVDTTDGRKEIVCGALNARAGLTTIYAPIGAYIPGTGITLEPKPVRGVVSHGMLCSEAELELEDDLFGLRRGRLAAWVGRAQALGKDEAAALADGGIAELDDATPVGRPLAQVLGLTDPMVEIEVTPNRGDWLGVAGIARDLAAAGLGKLTTKAPAPVAGRFQSPLSVATETPEGCPLLLGRLVRGVRNGPSPAWLQERLRGIGIKPRSALVDITNFISFDRGRPLHVFDAAAIRGGIVARLGRPGESFVDLTGREVEVGPEMVVIADHARVLSLAGIMGGRDSGCSETTTDVFIESAWFDPHHIFQAGRLTGLSSDARYRFERHVDPGFVAGGLEMATRLILDVCGGDASEVVSAGAAPPAPRPVRFDPDHTRRLAGMAVSPARTKAILKALGFGVAPDPEGGKALLVQPPTFRPDVTLPEDLVEEIARIEGFDRLPAPAPASVQGRRPAASVGEQRARRVRRALAAAGYYECVGWSFCPAADAALFGHDQGQIAALTLANPIAADLDCMRPSPLPQLLRAAQRNKDRGRGGARLFEVGPAYAGDQPGDQRRVAAAVWQPQTQRHWRGGPAADVYDLKADALAALAAAGAPAGGLQLGPPSAPWQHPGRGATIKLGPVTLGAFGEVHPRILAALDVEGPAFAFELALDALPAPKAKAGRARPPLEKLDLMPLSRDFAFILEDATPAAAVVRAAMGADPSLIEDVTVFDLYRGPGVPEGKKSLAIEVRLQPKLKTLTDPEIETVSGKIVGAVVKATGGALRG